MEIVSSPAPSAATSASTSAASRAPHTSTPSNVRHSRFARLTKIRTPRAPRPASSSRTTCRQSAGLPKSPCTSTTRCCGRGRAPVAAPRPGSPRSV